MAEPTYPLSAEVIGKIRDLREMQKLSAQDLADRMTSAGFTISRSVISNYENGRKESLSIDFADAAARSLGTDLVTLLTMPPICPTCKGTPPAGFTCNACGGGS
jgi:transcriptional regulator with XRE-family HTH domain